jgi:hypothetical protein
MGSAYVGPTGELQACSATPNTDANASVRTTSYALSTSALVEGSLQRLSEITSVVCSILKELETRCIDQFEEMPLRAICVGGPEGVSSESTSIHISDDINPRCN